VLLVWIGPRLPAPSTATCDSAPLTFCATLPPFRSPDVAPTRLIDQARPCEDPAALASSTAEAVRRVAEVGGPRAAIGTELAPEKSR